MASLNALKRTGKRPYRRVGRGQSSTRGKQSGRGGKGQTARAGNKRRPELRDIIKKLPKRRGYGKNRGRTFNHRFRLTPWAEWAPAFAKIIGGVTEKKFTIKGCGIGSARGVEKAGGSVALMQKPKKHEPQSREAKEAGKSAKKLAE